MTISAGTEASWAEFAARQFEPPRRRWATPGDLARDLNPKTVQTPALDLIDEALVELLETPNSRLIITMPPQEGKSTRVAKDFVVWALNQHPEWRVVGASYGQSLANRNGLAVRRVVERNHEALGLRVASDNGAAGDWSVANHDDSGLFSVGIGGGVTGQKCDLLIIDDPIKSRIEADSKVYRNRVWDWWTDEASARFGAETRAVLILTRWHHDDLAGRLLAEKDSDWRILNVPAECVDPSTDPLGRELGEFMVSARGRTHAQWEQRKKAAGSRTWASLYQGNPTPDTGNLFPADKWSRYTTPHWIVRDDGARIVPDANHNIDVELVQSWDFTFKDTDHSDYVVGQVWMRRGIDAFLLDQVRARMTFSESCQAMIDMTARWPQAIAKLVEDKANGPAILNSLRSKVGGLIPVEPEGSKYARASAITPFVEGLNVHLPDPVAIEGTAWVTDLTEEARDFPSATHDDTVDAMSQAVHRLLLVPLLSDEMHDADDLLDQLEDEPLDWAPTY